MLSLHGIRANKTHLEAAMKQAVCAFLLTILGGVLPVQAQVGLVCSDNRQTVFAKEQVRRHVVVTSSEAVKGRLTWRLSAANATLASGELPLDLKANDPADSEIAFQAPEIKEGVRLPAQFEAAFVAEGSDKPVRLVRPLTIFALDAFAFRKEWLKGLEITLFDPAEKTYACFEKHEVAFKAVNKVDAISELKKGVLVVGEGVSFADYKGLAGLLHQAAARGIAVIVLALAGGEFPLAGTGDPDVAFPVPLSMSMSGPDIIRKLDKQLDVAGWPPDGAVADARLCLRGDKGPVTVEVAQGGGDGWVWLELDYRPEGNRLIACGFPIIRKWETAPSASYLFAAILESLEKGKTQGN